MMKYYVNKLLISYFGALFLIPTDCVSGVFSVQYLSIRTDVSFPSTNAHTKPHELWSFRSLIVTGLLMRLEEDSRSASHNLSMRINSALRTNYIASNSKLFTDL